MNTVQVISVLALWAAASALRVQDNPRPMANQQVMATQEQRPTSDDVYSKFKRAIVFPENFPSYNPYSMFDGGFPYFGHQQSAPLVLPPQMLSHMHMAFLPVPRNYQSVVQPRPFSSYSESIKSLDNAEVTPEPIFHTLPYHTHEPDTEIFASLRSAPQAAAEAAPTFMIVPSFYPYSHLRK